MENKKPYWAIGIIAAVLIVFLLVFGVFSGNADTQPQNASSADNGQTNDSSGTTIPTNGTDTNNTSDSDALTKYLKEQDEIMTEMMEDMEEETREDHSDNASLAFLEGMIPHHEAAIEMAESYLKYGGSHSELKQLATDIIDTQTREIDEMERLEDEIEATGTGDSKQLDAYLDDYTKMMEDHNHMNHGSSSANNVEQAFAEGMIMHHRMAVDMAKAILDRTDHAKVKELAQTIIDTQEKEIKTMEELF